jgi:MerC mercury resistance protein
MNWRINWDALGISASLACAIHCAILPMLYSSLPLFGVNIIDNVFFEYFMIALAFAIGAFSLWHGYKKHHHSLLPLAVFSIGMILLLAKQVWHQYQIPLLVAAVILIVIAHFRNYKMCRVHNHAHADDCNH